MTALMLIDLQKAIDHPKWRQHGDRNNFQAEAHIAHLLEAWRGNRRPIYHIRHDSTEPESPYRPHQLGNEFKPFAAPHPGETVIAKQTNSAFIGTPLESTLRAAGHDTSARLDWHAQLWSAARCMPFRSPTSMQNTAPYFPPPRSSTFF